MSTSLTLGPTFLLKRLRCINCSSFWSDFGREDWRLVPRKDWISFILSGKEDQGESGRSPRVRTVDVYYLFGGVHRGLNPVSWVDSFGWQTVVVSLPRLDSSVPGSFVPVLSSVTSPGSCFLLSPEQRCTEHFYVPTPVNGTRLNTGDFQ